MQGQEVRVDAGELRRFATEIFVKVGMPPDDAEIEAEVLVWANLRGVDSHGVLRIPWYVQNVDDGVFNTAPNIRVERETPATILIEGERITAVGPSSAVRSRPDCMNWRMAI